MRIAVEGARLFVDVDGAKLRPVGPWLQEVPTVVVVVAPDADHSEAKGGASRLAESAQVVYVDPRGRGRSDGEPGDVETSAADLRALCAKLAIERPVLFAVGDGSLVAQRFEERWPDAVANVVLAEAS